MHGHDKTHTVRSASGQDGWRGFGTLKVKTITGGLVHLVSPHTQHRIMEEIDRLLMELDHARYEQLFGFFPVPILREICLKLPYLAKFPWVNDPAEFAKRVKRIQTRSALESLLSSLEEPPAEELREIIQMLRSLAPTAKRILAFAARHIQPVGGPKEQLSDPVKIRAIYDEILEAEKNGESRRVARERVMERERVGPKTLQRRLADERRRRASLKRSSDSAVDGPSDPTSSTAEPEDLVK